VLILFLSCGLLTQFINIPRNNNNDNNNNNNNNNNNVEIPNSHNQHSTIIKKLPKCADLKEDHIRIWQLKTPYTIPLVLSTAGVIGNKRHESLKLLNLRPAVYIVLHRAIGLNACV
jgi:hypothetical protein